MNTIVLNSTPVSIQSNQVNNATSNPAQKIASDIQLILNQLQNLQTTPLSEFAQSVNSLQNDINGARSILPSDMSKMYESFLDNVLKAPLSLGSSVTLLSAVDEALTGNLTDLKTFVTTLASQPAVLQMSITTAQNSLEAFNAYAANPPPVEPDDQVKDAAQAMSSKMQSFYTLLQELQKDPSLADDSIFQALIASDVNVIATQFSWIQGHPKLISNDDLNSMFTSFNNLMNFNIPQSSEDFRDACFSALRGDPSECLSYINQLSADSDTLDTFITSTNKAEQEFQDYANKKWT